MRKILIPLIVFLLFAGCYQRVTQRELAEAERKKRVALEKEEENYNPCIDPRFLALRKKSIDSLTMREYDFVRQMEDKCSKYKEEQNTTSPFGTAILVTLGVLLTIALVAKLGL